MVKQQGIGTSHAKIILMGEHSVVYGQPAIALPLPSVHYQLRSAVAKITSELLKAVIIMVV